MSDPKIYICTSCAAEHLGTKILTPPDWTWRGSVLVCGDCTGLPANYIPRAARQRERAR